MEKFSPFASQSFNEISSKSNHPYRFLFSEVNIQGRTEKRGRIVKCQKQHPALKVLKNLYKDLERAEKNKFSRNLLKCLECMGYTVLEVCAKKTFECPDNDIKFYMYTQFPKPHVEAFDPTLWRRHRRLGYVFQLTPLYNKTRLN
ncbi:hypothetical protein NQ317_008601 [Molorchus minor]|uniref:Uncharacterized protein n=1 Tax=Molorchus minor TaxID=1323400 RepID=A0ABQ9JBJ5_9CUCU|nr:hypothetical protein NQ317_008601 [Molorchus minor]